MSSNTIIQLKRSAISGNTISSSEINYGELAINYADGKLFYRKTDDSVGTIYTPNVYNTFNVNSTLLVPTTPSEILSLQPTGAITVVANTTTDTIIIGETLTGNVLLKTGGTISGDLTVTGSTKQKDSTIFSSNTSLSTVSETVIDSFSSTAHRSAKYMVQITDNVSNYYHVTELMLIWDASTVQKVEYAVVTTAGELGTLDADINTGSVRLLFTATDTHSRTIRFVRTLINS